MPVPTAVDGLLGGDEVAQIAAATQGDSASFARLIYRYQRRVRVFISTAISRPEAVDDLAQEVFVSAYFALPEFRPGASFQAWLLGIARNKLLMFLRTEGRRLNREGSGSDALLWQWRLLALQSDRALPENLDDELRALELCVAGLPPVSAAMVQGYHLEGRSIAEVAADVGKSVTAVRMALLRVRRALRECVQGRLTSEAG